MKIHKNGTDNWNGRQKKTRNIEHENRKGKESFGHKSGMNSTQRECRVSQALKTKNSLVVQSWHTQFLVEFCHLNGSPDDMKKFEYSY